MPPQLPPESHYDPKKQQKIFAIVTIVLLFSLIGLFAKDYSRTWKKYQRQFREFDVEKTRVKIDAEENDLKNNSEYQSLLKDLEIAKKDLDGQRSAYKAVKDKIDAALVQEKLNTQQYQFAKAESAALRYQYEGASNHQIPGDAQKIKNQLDATNAKADKYRLLVESAQKSGKDAAKELTSIEKKFKDFDKKRLSIVKRKDILERKIRRIDIQEMSVANQLAEMVRDLPIIDLANPNYKINQIVLKDIPEDVNFAKVPRVDRCTTCHLGIDNPDFKSAPQPLTAHPNLEMFLDKNSPHPLDQYGCTTCHQGRGRATDFTQAAHTPRDEHQAKEWEEKYQWKELHHWEQPMFPAQFSQAGCFKCHQDQGVVKGADQLNKGMALIEKAGCYGCHAINRYKSWPKVGPTLEYIASKTTKQWAYHWIENPKAVRPNTWMPSYFNQSNNSDPKAKLRGQQEILAMVDFIFANSKPFSPEKVTEKGNPVKGKELVASIGCLACHQENPKPNKEQRTTDSLRREFGPNLIGLGSKTSQAWLIDWLKNPSRYHGQTRMPQLRLNDQEAADIASYLTQSNSPITSKPIPTVNDAILDTIVLDFLKKSDAVADAHAKLASMNQNDKLQFAGKKLVREYGCFSCHSISGFENEKPIGVELNEEGSKSIERFDFGFTGIEHTKHAWFKQKLMDPRIFDKGRELEPLDHIKMPNFQFTEDEAEAVTTVLLGLVKDRPDAAKMPNQGVAKSFINQGQMKIKQFNCQACHEIEGNGRTVQPTVEEWLVNYQSKQPGEAKTLASSFSPPSLLGEGAKVQPQWLYNFLHDPITIRPWLSLRMPSYNYHAGELNTIVKYFNYLDQEEFPFTDMYHPNMSKEEFAAAEKLFSKEVFGCTLCHVVGNQMPSGSQDSWAPNLGLANGRLKPEWIVKWITNPSAVLPGTKMPTFYDPKDFEHAGPPDILNGDSKAQIKALRDYLLTISEKPELIKSEAPTPAPVKAEAETK